MCGIIGYIGQKEAYPILLAGLERMEYRGYDSAGICTANNNQLFLKKDIGRVKNLKTTLLPGTKGIGHTRWATHGGVLPKNAHPFILDNFTLIHNGIIENHLELKENLRKTTNRAFTSDTDSEVILHLIKKHYQNNLLKAVQKTITQLQGAYAFAVMKQDTDEIIAARNGCPLIIGIGNNENFLASDIAAFIEHTKKVIYLNDFEIATITPTTINIYNFQGKEQKPKIKEIRGNIEQAEKQGYKHFMLKEIMEQPTTIAETLNVPITITKKPNRIIIIACGTASYAGLVGKYLIEKIARITVIHETASEFRYKDPIIKKEDLIIAISQSGETADTLAAVRISKQQQAQTLGIINVIDSTIAQEVEHVIYTRCGPEIGVASTKAFTAQLTILYKLAYHFAEKTWNTEELKKKITETVALNQSIHHLAQKYFHYHNFLYIGRNLNYPLVLEGALKLKEISYIHAEAYPAGELKHGPIALVSENTPTLALCPQDEVYEKTLNNIQEIKARNGKVIAIATEDDEKIKQIANDVIYIPKVENDLNPLIVAIPLQLFAYHIADIKECDIDKPRNLAKSVTVE